MKALLRKKITANTLKTIVGPTLAILCVILLLSYQLPHNGLLFRDLQNSGHVLIFCIISFSLAFSFRRTWFLKNNIYDHLNNDIPNEPSTFVATSNWHFILSIFIVCMTIGGSVELIQNQIGRRMTWLDLGLDSIGTISGLLIYVAVHDYRVKALHMQITRKKSMGLILTAGIFLILGFANPIMSVIGLYNRDSALPILFDAEKILMNRLTGGRNHSTVSIVSAPQQWKENTTFVAKVVYPMNSRWPSITILEPAEDWSNYNFLYFEIFSQNRHENKLTLRIHDKRHNKQYFDRFNKNLQLKQGLNRFSIELKDIRYAPQSREFDLQKVEEVSWFFAKPKQDHLLYFDNIELRKEHHSVAPRSAKAPARSDTGIRTAHTLSNQSVAELTIPL